MSEEREENPYVHRKLPALQAAEQWLTWKREAIQRNWDDPAAVDRILKDVYLEGYADRLRDELKELPKPETKRRVQRRKK